MAEKLKSRKCLKYEEFVEDREGSTGKKLILFDPSKSSLEEWLQKNKPSETAKEDGIGWIAVESKLIKEQIPIVDGIENAWEELIKSDNITFSAIQDLAKSYNITQGKWMFYVETGEIVDVAWELVASNIVNGNLGKFCYYAKVSPFESRFEELEHVITVHNPNFINRGEVEIIEKELRNIGILLDLLYKPSIYTCLKIYPKNEWNIIPTIYVSRYDDSKKDSKIEKKPFRKMSAEELNSIIKQFFDF